MTTEDGGAFHWLITRTCLPFMCIFILLAKVWARMSALNALLVVFYDAARWQDQCALIWIGVVSCSQTEEVKLTLSSTDGSTSQLSVVYLDAKLLFVSHESLT